MQQGLQSRLTPTGKVRRLTARCEDLLTATHSFDIPCAAGEAVHFSIPLSQPRKVWLKSPLQSPKLH